jgi:hypothetical protein
MGRPRGHRQSPQTQPPEIDRLRLVLRALIAMASLSRREVQRRIAGNGYQVEVPRLLAGRMDLKVRHVLEICRVIGVHPLEVFRMVIPEPPQPSALVAEVAALLRPAQPSALMAAVTERLLASEPQIPGGQGRVPAAGRAGRPGGR